LRFDLVQFGRCHWYRPTFSNQLLHRIKHAPEHHFINLLQCPIKFLLPAITDNPDSTLTADPLLLAYIDPALRRSVHFANTPGSSFLFNIHAPVYDK